MKKIFSKTGNLLLNIHTERKTAILVTFHRAMPLFSVEQVRQTGVIFWQDLQPKFNQTDLIYDSTTHIQ